MPLGSTATALKVAAPETSDTVAVIVLAPVLGPAVNTTDAWPLVLVVVEVVESCPPPSVTSQVTADLHRRKL
jgi:hypothetical protein